MTEAIAVKVERIAQIGYLTLDKPGTLNALDVNMVRELHRGLDQHSNDNRVAAIVIRSTSDRAFCAGGDIKYVRERILYDELEDARDFFRQEYALNLAIAQSRKPYIAILNGVAMGGGLGISIHGRYRIVTEHARLAMPEARIGLFTDVGGTHFLPRLPRRAGWWLAFCSESVFGSEAVQCGLATHFVDSSSLPALYESLENTAGGDVDTVINSLARQYRPLAGDATLGSDAAFAQTLRLREAWFSADTASSARLALQSAIDTAMDDSTVADAERLLTQLTSASPHSLQLIECLFDKHAGQSLELCLQAELEAIMVAVRHPDFAEGVRALLVDKDHSPVWRESIRPG